MTPRDPDLEHLTMMLGRCLGRIDEQAYRLQQLGEDDEDFAAADLLEDETARLQELVGSLLAVHSNGETADFNRVVDRAVQACIGELQIPIVLRMKLEPDLPSVNCSAAVVAFAVQRALVLATDSLEPGSELDVTTRAEGDSILLEMEVRGHEADRRLFDRSETLREFVDGLGGRLQMDVDPASNLCMVIELPQELAIGDRDSA